VKRKFTFTTRVFRTVRFSHSWAAIVLGLFSNFEKKETKNDGFLIPIWISSCIPMTISSLIFLGTGCSDLNVHLKRRMTLNFGDVDGVYSLDFTF